MFHGDDRCSVQRSCSSTGKACGVDDRACQTEAVSGGLEVTCETAPLAGLPHREGHEEGEPPRMFVYCPPGAQQRDSNVVWILLLVAFGVAAVGGVLSVFLFRKRLSA